ncbi:MAG: helical backbone metal receptor [Bacteroidetes bacterium]|nr:helical backbone metal receptor [Bacteroidota bacterium]MCX7906834.1 helical backbone metal receptor [Bacteroidota bacterium]MDW8136887.1 helical backbone metal receptor [Bacteroidota bacterium]
MTQHTDALGRTVYVAAPPQRIVSLVPSLTETLYALGLGERIVGVTRFCVHPPEARRAKPIVGGTKALHLERIRELRPDLIVANQEENRREDIETLERDFAVYVTVVRTIPEAIDMIRALGIVTGAQARAEELVCAVEAAQSAIGRLPRLGRALYLIWREPYMSVGRDTFIHAMLEAAGLENACADQSRYPVLEAEAIRELRPDYVLLPSEPYRFKPEHEAELRTLLPETPIVRVNGELFSWYGARMREAFPYLQDLHRRLAAR